MVSESFSDLGRITYLLSVSGQTEIDESYRFDKFCLGLGFSVSETKFCSVGSQEP